MYGRQCAHFPFGNHQFHTGRGESKHALLELFYVGIVHTHMSLHTYGIDAQAPFLQVVDDFHVSVSFSGIAHAVIIEVEFCFRIGFICILEGERYVFLT